jgi:hypothetical protein
VPGGSDVERCSYSKATETHEKASDDLPDPDVLAQQIVDDMQTVLEESSAVVERVMDMTKWHNPNAVWYDLMQVCENGHKITGCGESCPDDLIDRCTECGAVTLTACPRCETELQGCRHDPDESDNDYSLPPEFCHKCGSPFPWTGKRRADSPEQEPVPRIERILDRFHLVARQLRQRHDHRPTLDITDEYDVQDLLHALLKLQFDDVRTEEWTPSYAGGCSRMDFLLKKEQVVLEVKRTSQHVGVKQVGEQLLVDIAKYAAHPDCKTLICFVYDPDGRIGNPDGLKVDLEARNPENPKVLVHVRPR